MTLDPGLQLALDACNGNESALARAAGVKQVTVWHWINTGKGRIPAERVPAIARSLGLPIERLRADLFGQHLNNAPGGISERNALAGAFDPFFHGSEIRDVK